MAPLDDFFDHSASAPDARVIAVRGAREHNLKNVDLVIPRDKLVVFTGLSGSGKSSLAFDTIYAEGQRRYVESLSSYARQFLEMMQKPDVDQIDGLSPAISIEQKTTSQKPALDGRHRHRDLRLHASALGAGRHPLFARDRAADREPDGQPDGRPGAGAAGKDAAVPARARGARPQGRVPQGDRRVSEEGLSAPQDRRRILRHRRDPDARQEAQARHRRGGGPHRGAARHRRAAGGIVRDRAGAGGRHRGDRVRGRAAGKRLSPRGGKRRRAPYRLQPKIRLPRLRLHDSRDRAPPVLLQQPVRRLPALRRHRARDADRCGAHRSGRNRHLEARRHRALGALDLALLRPDAREHRPALHGLDHDQVGRSARDGAGGDPLRLQGADPLRLRRRPARLRGEKAFRRRHHQPGAPLQGDRERLGARGHRPLHERDALRHLRRQAAEARGAGGEDRRLRHRRRHGPLRARGARLVRGAAPKTHREAERNRGPHPERDPRPPDLPGRCRPRIPHPRPRLRHPVGRREPAHPPGEPDRLRPHGRALRARRALDRPAPARQRAPARHAEAPARPRQHRHRGRARRGRDSASRLRGRCRPRRRHPRRRDRRPRQARRHHGEPRLAHRAIPVRRTHGAGAAQAPQAATRAAC